MYSPDDNISYSITLQLQQNANTVYTTWRSTVIVSFGIYNAKYASLEKMVMLSVQFNPRI